MRDFRFIFLYDPNVGFFSEIKPNYQTVNFL